MARSQRLCVADGKLTDGGEDTGEAEVVNSIEREQMEEELLLLLLTAQEGVTFVQLPVAVSQVRFRYSEVHHISPHQHPCQKSF